MLIFSQCYLEPASVLDWLHCIYLVAFADMSSGTHLSEEQLQCSICLAVFTDPVSTPCGHNFCMWCIKEYWDTIQNYQCPMCKETFSVRPALKVNTTFREVVDDFKKRSGLAKPEVPCDICTGSRPKAVKSCLVCMVSYCEAHLEPHERVAVLKKHTLIDPVKNMEERMCKKHERLLEFFCRDDKMCLCLLCYEAEHQNHSTSPLDVECAHSKVRRLGSFLMFNITTGFKMLPLITHMFSIHRFSLRRRTQTYSWWLRRG